MNNGGKLKKTAFYAGIMFTTVLLCLLALFLTAFMPQSMISRNVIRSAEQLHTEGPGIRIFDHVPTAELDNYTDSLIIMESETMHAGQLSAVLTNPYFYESENFQPVDVIYEHYVNGAEYPTEYYVRYWMGFRALIRPLLCFLDYFQIRRYLGIAFFVLMFSVILSVAKHSGFRNAFCLGLGLVLVRPQVICSSIQYLNCFLQAFAAMLLVPWISRKPKWERAFFLIIGMLTMYFDFYTVPLITLGLPLIYLSLLQFHGEAPKHHIKSAVLNVLFWLLGYGFMWFAKMGLTTVLTPVNGFSNAITSFIYHIGIEKTPGFEDCYGVGNAFRQLFEKLFADVAGQKIALAAGAVLVLVLVILTVRKKFSPRNAFCNPVLLLAAALPFLWFAAAAQPICIHAFFQYRSIVVFYWAVGLMICGGFGKEIRACAEIHRENQ